ncbi:M14 family zinc carboxypeptidase [Pseudoxanthomonas winnipegensis]|uniref:Peptidase M14 n=1 Tax=Pseudoxanthomonas winnipegensis TaxID=2480810 RepID=A0A4Q8LJZ6_9GAMM|nr:M14 family zinc carboxypeptidase [Pseudoxanthomonas winnipegensis]RZZ87870.1 peptidase M14 [Pseudoxanthomonas winnipegensis]TAA30007.1 peptidase M14 [Pseudoxanthomonas winnipegensis]TAA36943.1 peptidase M14 [Pseudoxanthomonas winnipegensis]TBV78149.1 peptidase M14 [Pseudoxanthomonas winnipegensis]
MRLRPALLACLLLSPLAPVAAAPSDAALISASEASGFTRTGRYEEVGRLCAAFAARWPQAVRCFDFGTTPEGRPLHAMAISTSGALDPAAARARGLPVVLIQGGIHPGEIDGKDAGFLVARQLLESKRAKGTLDKVVWLFVPVFNADGHERFGPWNRPNQRGPEEMGFRATAQNLNLNRDYMKADAPEMQAMLALVDAWDPLIAMDLHVTDGAKFRHDISVQVEPSHEGDATLQRDGQALRAAMIAQLDRQGSHALPFYPSLAENDNPAAGFADEIYPPRFSHGYFQLRNRFGVLVETHSWLRYPQRVAITGNAIVAVLQQAAVHGAAWRGDAAAADEAATRLGGQPQVLDWKANDTPRMIDFLGYAYTRTPSEVSGGLMTRYDEDTPQVWHIPLRDTMEPAVTTTAPRAGYLVPVAWAPMVEPRLRAHGLQYRRLDAALDAPAQAYRATRIDFDKTSTEGHQRLKLAGAWADESAQLPAGSLFVPIAQPRARLVVALLDPDAPDSLLQWGLFNAAFERKEYMESYVAEDVARQMLRDPQVKAAFEQRLKDDAAFAASPRARLEFFARRHPSWDTRYGLYPVLRTDQTPR